MTGSKSIEIEVEGKVYRAEGFLKVGIGRHQRQTVQGGFNERPILQFVEGSVVFREPIRGDALRAIDGATLTYSEASGWRFTLRNAWVEYANDGAHPNEYQIKIVGEKED